MDKKIELMKKLIEEKKAKGREKQGKKIPSRYGNQSSGSGKISSIDYSK